MHYSRFRVAERLLLTGHSHQAWPDCGFRGQQRAWEDAARLVDGKWEEAFARAERVRSGYAGLLGTPERLDDGDYALGSNTHELVVRFLSALPLLTRPRLVTTDGEFHSVRRQLDRLEEEGLTIVRVPVDPIDSLSERLARATDDAAAGVLVSAVLYRDARIVGGLDRLAERCRRVGAELLVDAYHALNAIPLRPLEPGTRARVRRRGPGTSTASSGRETVSARATGLSAASGGHRMVRGVLGPARTRGRGPGPIRPRGGTVRRQHVRSDEPLPGGGGLDFFREQGLTPVFLRAVSRHQVDRLSRAFDALDADPRLIDRDRETPPEAVGGFLALRTPRALDLHEALADRGVATDYRDDLLRLGPAPYLSDRQLDDAIAALGEAVSGL